MRPSDPSVVSRALHACGGSIGRHKWRQAFAQGDSEAVLTDMVARDAGSDLPTLSEGTLHLMALKKDYDVDAAIASRVSASQSARGKAKAKRLVFIDSMKEVNVNCVI